MKKLLELMGSDISNDSAILFFLEKPIRPTLLTQSMGCDVCYLQNITNRPLSYHLTGQPGTFVVQTLAVVNQILPTGRLYRLPRLLRAAQAQ